MTKYMYHQIVKSVRDPIKPTICSQKTTTNELISHMKW